MKKRNAIAIGYRHTGIICKNINKSLLFYKNFLGLELIQEFTDKSKYINEITNLKNAIVHFYKLSTLDGSVIELLEYKNYKTEPIKHSTINVGICHIALKVHDADKAYKFLKKKGVRVLSKPILSSEGIAKVFFCLDPDNVRVELVEMINE